MFSAEFSWSVSRHDTFQRCRRRYFYSYYAAPHDPEIYRLKKLSALAMWAGNVVHDAIESFLGTHDAIPAAEAQEALIHEIVHGRMVTDWRDSEGGSERFRLFEHEYGVPVEHDDKKRVVGIVKRSMRNLFRSDTLKEAFATGRENWLTVEDLIDYDAGGITARLRMDLAYRNADGRIVIVDWKTGRGEGKFSEVQVAGYALYAAEHGWADSAEEIETELAYLARDRYVRRSVNAAGLKSARAFIARSAARMKELLHDPNRDLARIEDFPMIDRPYECKRCCFRRLCFPPSSDHAAG